MKLTELKTNLFTGSPTDGGYTPWSPWSACSRTCAGGSQQRYRFCTDPLPVNGGKDCKELGPDTESKGCNRQSCQGKEIILHFFYYFYKCGFRFYLSFTASNV